MEKLIKDVLQGKQTAQNQFYDQFSGLVMGICRRYFQNQEEVADAFQDAFIKIFKNLHQVKDAEAIYGWVRRITVNTALDHLKVQPIREPLDGAGHELSDQFYTELMDQLSNETLLLMINQLPDGYRVIFNLSVLDGYSHREIADRLGISESTSRSQLTHAKKLLKKHLNEIGITRYEQVI